MSICFDLVKLLLLFEYKKAYLLLQYIWSSLSIPFTICTQNDKVLQPNVLLGCLITCYNFVAMVKEALTVYLALHHQQTHRYNPKWISYYLGIQKKLE